MAFQRVIRAPHNLESISAFLSPEEQNIFAQVDERIEHHFELEKGNLRDYFRYRYPFLRVVSLKKAEAAFERVHRNPLYLRETNIVTHSTPAWHAFQDKRYDLASQYLQWGGLLAVTEQQKEQLRQFPSLLVEYPELSLRIRRAKLDGAKTEDEKRKVLQWMLEEYCHKGHLQGVQWVLKTGFDLSLFKPLENAIRGGFEEIVSLLCPRIKDDDKPSFVGLCVEMGYPELLPILKKNGFPVTEDQERRMADFGLLQKKLIPHIRFPEAPNATAHAAHGGDTNKSIREKEYVDMVVYAYSALRNGASIKTVVNHLGDRRRRMAVLCKLKDLDNYGTPTKKTMGTGFDSSYKEYGDRIKAKYAEFPVKVTARIGETEIPLTTITAERWEHPDGTHRDAILTEVSRLGAPLCTARVDDFARPLSKIIWLISHYPPAQRGTPIILRAVVDALCLLQNHKTIDPSYEINCDALVYADSQEFTTEFMSKVS